MTQTPQTDGPQLRLVSNADQPAANTEDQIHQLRLYVAGETPKSLAAIANLRALCETHLPGCYAIEVVDLAKNPELAASDQIVALPTLVRRRPPPLRRIIGSLSDAEKVLDGLDLPRTTK